MNGLIDTHAHFTDSPYLNSVDNTLKKMAENRIASAIVPGYSLASCRMMMDMCHRFPHLLFAPGVHPMYLESGIRFIDELKAICHSIPCIAIGEIGLDNRRNAPPAAVQTQAFRIQLALAADLDRPVIIHCVKAHEPCLKVLRAFHSSGSAMQGVIHRVSCARETAEHYLALGFCFSFGPDLFDQRRQRLHDLAKWMPEDRILLETDAPYSHLSNGEVCNPWDIRLVLEYLADLRGVPAAQLETHIRNNTFRLFGV